LSAPQVTGSVTYISFILGPAGLELEAGANPEAAVRLEEIPVATGAAGKIAGGITGHVIDIGLLFASAESDTDLTADSPLQV